MKLDEVREDLGVGFAGEDVAQLEQPRAQDRVVLDDAVVHDGDSLAAIQVRVRVGVGRAAMRCPTRMSDADGPGERFAVIQALGEPRELPLGFGARQRSGRVDHRDAGAVVAAILQATQRVQDDRNAIALADISDDPAHALPLRTPRDGEPVCLHYFIPSRVRR